MTRRNTNNVLQSSFVEMTKVVREQATEAQVMIGDGEDDGEQVLTSPPTVEVVTKVKARPEFIRYIFARRDNRPGSEVYFTNGHIFVVQDTVAALKVILPTFVDVHSSGAPSDILVNPALVRYFEAVVDGTGSLLSFPNGNKLLVTETYDELYGKFAAN